MNYEPYWNKDETNSGYCLIFPNKKALEKSQIRTIFSEFGNVINVTAAGDERGFRFVRYATLEEAIRAIDGLKNHPDVGLIPHRSKNKNQSNGNAGGTQNRNSSSNSNFFPRKNRHSEERKPEKLEDKVEDLRSNFDNLSTSGGSQKSFGSTNKNSCPINRNQSFSNLNGESKTVKMTNDHNLDPKSPEDKADMLMKLRGTNANTFAPRNSPNTEIKQQKTHQTGSESRPESLPDNDDIPQLITFPENPIAGKYGSKKTILNAEEVIVANIPRKFGSAYILHILEHFEPIAITDIYEVPKKNIRYCHVYFKSAEDAVAVETQFDELSIDGTQLVVLRPCRLMEEAMD